jgi:hypothetical protein
MPLLWCPIAPEQPNKYHLHVPIYLKLDLTNAVRPVKSYQCIKMPKRLLFSDSSPGARPMMIWQHQTRLFAGIFPASIEHATLGLVSVAIMTIWWKSNMFYLLCSDLAIFWIPFTVPTRPEIVAKSHIFGPQVTRQFGTPNASLWKRGRETPLPALFDNSKPFSVH